MNYTENYNGVKLDVQAVDVHLPESAQLVIRESVDKIAKHVSKINSFDVYLKDEKHPTEGKSVHIRVGVPGPDLFAEENGEHWEPVIRSVTHKLLRQLEK